jgi:hypothetical protein
MASCSRRHSRRISWFLLLIIGYTLVSLINAPKPFTVRKAFKATEAKLETT